MSTKAEPRTVPLATRWPSTLSPEQAIRLLGPAADAWLGTPTDTPPAGMRRFATELRFEVGSGDRRARIGKAAFVDLGSPQRVGGQVRVEISWRAATFAPLFPVFSGWLTVRRGETWLDGQYAPPGGAIGVVADRALLHVAAHRTARWFLGELERAADNDPSLTNTLTTEDVP